MAAASEPRLQTANSFHFSDKYYPNIQFMKQIQKFELPRFLYILFIQLCWAGLLFSAVVGTANPNVSIASSVC